MRIRIHNTAKDQNPDPQQNPRTVCKKMTKSPIQEANV